MNIKIKRPLVSVITAVRNGKSHIKETIESILAQDYENIEYIVIDGDSNDGTQNVVRSFENRFPRFQFISEPDNGISDAWNKGVARAKGEYIAFLNADDAYQPTFIRRAIEASQQQPLEIIYSNTLIVDEYGQPVDIIEGSYKKNKIYWGFQFKHPSCVTSRAVFEKCGPFDESVKIACDTDFLLRAIKADTLFLRANGVVRMRMGGVSDRNWERAAHEHIKALVRHGFLNHSSERRERILVKIRAWNRRLRIAPALRQHKSQLYFIGLKIINLTHSILPFTFRPAFYKACAMEVDTSACIQSNVRFFHVGRLKVGKLTLINRGVYLDNRATITIGNYVNIAHDAKIYTLGHEINDDAFTTKGKPVFIEDHAVIFSNALIMPGVRIGKGAVVLPGAVVTKSVNDFTVVGGNPAAEIRKRDSDPIYSFRKKYWFTH